MIDPALPAPSPIGNTLQKLPLPALLLAILLLATAVRFHRLGEQSLWYDEGVAYAHSLRTLPELIPLLQRNVHLPAYFTLLGWWQDWTGSSEFALRALSALFSIVSVAWTYALGKVLFHPGAGLAAAALVALNSFSIYYAQEARMYAMLTAIAGGSMWLYIGLLRGLPPLRPRWLAVMSLGLLNALGFYTHIAYALIILTQVLLAALWLGRSCYRDRGEEPAMKRNLRLLIQFVLVNLLTLMLVLPWLPVSIQQVFAQPNLSQPIATDQLLRLLFGTLAFGITFEQAVGNLGFVIVFLMLFGLLPGPRRHNSRQLLFPVMWLLVSVAIYAYLGLTTRYLRFLLPAQLAVALWLGRGAWMLWQPPFRESHMALRAVFKLVALIALGALLMTQFSGLALLYHGREFQRDDVRGLVGRIESELREGDAVLVSAAGLQEVLSYYYRGDAPVYGLPTSADAGDTASAVLQMTLMHRRIFTIFYGSEEQDPKRAVEINLNAHSYQASQEWVGDIRFARFIVPADESFNERRSPDLPFGDVIRLAHYWTSAKPVARGEYLLVGIFWLANGTPETRYKVFVQLLDMEGRLVAQRDSEPAGGTWPTSSWEAGYNYYDYHALLIPEELPTGEYTLIAGLYDINDPAARLPVGDSSYVDLGTIEVTDPG